MKRLNPIGIREEPMSIGQFYSVPEIDLRTVTESVYASCIDARRSTEKAEWAGGELENLAGKRPEELPPCFLAVKADALSARTGWQTDHGRWEPKGMFAGLPSVRPHQAWRNPMYSRSGNIPEYSITRTTLFFFPPNSKVRSEFCMALYNLMRWDSKTYVMEEDLALCRVFRVTKEKGKAVIPSEAFPPLVLQSPSGSADPVNGFEGVVHREASPSSVLQSPFGYPADPVDGFVGVVQSEASPPLVLQSPSGYAAHPVHGLDGVVHREASPPLVLQSPSRYAANLVNVFDGIVQSEASPPLVLQSPSGYAADPLNGLHGVVQSEASAPLVLQSPSRYAGVVHMEVVLSESAAYPSNEFFGIVQIEASQPLVLQSPSGYAADLVNGFDGVVHMEADLSEYAAGPVSEFLGNKSDSSHLDVMTESNSIGLEELFYLLNSKDIDNDVGGSELPSDESCGGPNKRPRQSEVWHDFTRIHTKDSNVMYGACNHCGRMIKLTGGSGCGTKSLINHNNTCKLKPISSMALH